MSAAINSRRLNKIWKTSKFNSMQFIDKFGTFRSNALTINLRIFTDWWAQYNSLAGLQYSSNHLRQSGLDNVILTEQNNRCCYCMRKLYNSNKNDTDGVNHTKNRTWEHVIPQNCNINDLPNYQTYAPLAPNNVDVTTGGRITNTGQPINSAPFPHFLAYDNITASCDGTVLDLQNDSTQSQQTCNNKRQNQYIDPVFFDNNQCTQITYDDDGKMNYNSFIIDPANLNALSLRKIREFWYYIAKSNYNANDVRDAVKDQQKRDRISIDVLSSDGNKFNWIGNREYIWLTLSEYDWFYKYYKSKP